MEISKNDKAKIKKAQLEIQKMKNKAAATEKELMEHVKKDPEVALLVAAGIGAAIGAITVAVLKRKKTE
jgi:mannitol-specific phosphotransferase system IIBC component